MSHFYKLVVFSIEIVLLKAKDKHITSLIKACKKQDKVAQFKLYEMYYKAIYNTSYRILKDKSEAEDMMQETFITAFEKLDSFDGTATFGAWIKRIAINKSLTQLKSQNRFDETSLELVQEVAQEECFSLQSVDVKYVLKCMNMLKDKYRIALTLHFVEGYDYEEIADILGYTNQNVRKIISRGKQQLKQRINIQKVYER